MGNESGTVAEAAGGVSDAAARQARVVRAGGSGAMLRVLPAAAVLLPGAMFGLAALSAWHAAWDRARAEVAAVAEAGAEYAARTLGSYAVVAGRINEMVQAIPQDQLGAQEAAIHRRLAQLVGELRQDAVGFVVGADGVALAASHIFPVPRASLTDRDDVVVLSAPAAAPLHVGTSFAGRLNGQVVFALSRARQTPTGGFAGLTTISVSPGMLGEGLARLAQASSDSVILVREDGARISTLGPQTEPLPAVPEGSPLRAALASMSVGGSVIEDAGENAPRLVALRRVEGFPVVAVAARPRSAILRGWLSSLAGHLLFGVPATATLFLLALRVRRDQRALQEANARLAADVERGDERLYRARRDELVGTFEIDLRPGTGRRSADCMAAHGKAPRPAVETQEDWLRRVHPDDRARAGATLRAAIADDCPTRSYAETCRIVTPGGEVRWIAARGEVERDAQGRAVALRGVHADVTTLRSAEAALATSDARLRLAQEAVGIGDWEWLPHAQRLVLSARTLGILGFDPAEGQPRLAAVLRRILPADRAGVLRAARTALKAGLLRHEFRVALPGPDGAMRTAWVVARASAIDVQDGVGPHLIGVVHDVTERKEAEEYVAMLAHEAEHRAKNAMALVLGLIRMSDATDGEGMREALQGRVLALSRTVALLGRDKWRGAPLRRLVEQELAPYRGGDGARAEISGPPVMLDAAAAEALSIPLHELATNAAKHGALSRRGGRVAVSWTVRDGEVRFTWTERGGPPVEGPPARRGFGSELIRMAFEGRLGGSVAERWEPGGMVCEARFRLAPAEVAPAKVAPAALAPAALAPAGQAGRNSTTQRPSASR